MGLIWPKIAVFEIHFSPPRWIYYLVFTVSGFAGLIYESIWSHYLKLFLGHAALAQSLVLIIFMGGLALGAWGASVFSARLKSPILIYVVVEALIGLIALFFHDIFSGVIEYFYNSLLPFIGTPVIGSMAKWLTAALLITPQSILLGMTFPLMTAGILRRYPDTPGGSIAMLYFTNSIGAAAGVLASGFVFIKLWGLPGTILTAGLLNIALALVAWVLVRMDTQATTAPLSVDEEINSTYTVYFFLTVSAITGMASFIYEIGWIRMLSMVLGSTTHSFELMLSSFITGLALGGLWIKKRIDTIVSPAKYLGNVQIIMGVMALATIPIYVSSFDWMAVLIQSLNINSTYGFRIFTVCSHLIALLVMLPATFLAGMTLPLLTNLLLKNGYGEKSIGRIYSVNTIGAIVGILFAMHIGLPLLGMKFLIVVGALLDVGLGVWIIHKLAQSRVKNFDYIRTAVATVVIIYVALIVPLDSKLISSGVYRYGFIDENKEVLFHQDGKTASVTYFTSDGVGSISTNGKPDAGIVLDKNNSIRSQDEITMVLLGTLPFAYHPEAKTIANIGLGSGLTTHTILADKNIERVDTIEIEEAMVRGSQFFGEHVVRAHTDKRSVIHIDDAKTYFSINKKKYDIIIAEPSNPWVSGVASLFSEEFYSTITNYIHDDGLFVQWIQLYEFSDELLASILKAIDANFGDYAIYYTNSADILVVSKKQGQLGQPKWERLFESDYKHDLQRFNVANKNDIKVRFVSDRENIQKVINASPAQKNSDYFPYVDLHAGEARFRRGRSTLLQGWTEAPLPMLDMLTRYQLNYSQVTKNVYFARSQQIVLAQKLDDYLKNDYDSLPKEGVGGDLFQSLSILKLTNENCNFKSLLYVWEEALFDVGVAVFPFLDPSRAEGFLNAISGAECKDQTKTDLQGQLLQFFNAIANRNHSGMILYGTKLLELRDELRPHMTSYVISGVWLGLISNNQLARAKTLYEEEKNDFNFAEKNYNRILLALMHAN